jgi:hypothetical protein
MRRPKIDFKDFCVQKKVIKCSRQNKYNIGRRAEVNVTTFAPEWKTVIETPVPP